MKQETADHLLAADRAMAKAIAQLSLPLHDEAGRHAYYAMSHAAHALVVERGFKPAKTHRGLRQLFARVAHTEPSAIHSLVSPLTSNYGLIWVADYDTTGSIVSEATARAALADAVRFIAPIRAALATPPTP
jgi:uncharacterized protein (UPF0332 family)